ncbi:uncharacterized protein EI90DRAFT_3058327 [Cantharellus anzutake]|uniref:uncharacterized protein n=1 Tax=Cantharellus anzutake TaxID=1750568 RepID=UPI0019062765|nr:uncharacterized protein EI90DRAFT_3058327 [Cantharellus anzutake]KAF8331046.1 hypothetical protein EI90DRAFT_3058327 [Cantharellus anzutake]
MLSERKSLHMYAKIHPPLLAPPYLVHRECYISCRVHTILLYLFSQHSIQFIIIVLLFTCPLN